MEIADTLVQAVHGLQQDYLGHEGHGIGSGLPGFDAETGGLLPKTLHVVAGAPGAGKTAVALHVALTVARQGRPVAFLAGTEWPAELTRRMLLAESGIRPADVRRGVIPLAAWERITSSATALHDLPITYRDAIDVASLAGAELVVVDRRASPARLRALSYELNTAVLATRASVNAGAFGREDLAWATRADTYAVVSAPEKKRAGFRALGQKVAMRVVINRRGESFDLGADDGD